MKTEKYFSEIEACYYNSVSEAVITSPSADNLKYLSGKNCQVENTVRQNYVFTAGH